MIYLDHNATTYVLPEVVQMMLPYFTQHFGNTESRTHAFGWQAKAAVDVAREKILQSLGASPEAKLIFTSGATEANNLVIKGVVEASSRKPAHVITQNTEHACVLESCRWLEKQGHKVTYLPVDAEGFVDPDDLKKQLTDDTVLVSIMAANHEIGTLQDLPELIKITRQNSKAFFHTDASQAVCKMPINFSDLGVDFLSLSAHKLYGPKGIGALCVSSNISANEVTTQMHGGGHEDGWRSGTLNVAGIVGMSAAIEIGMRDLTIESLRLTKLREQLIDGLVQIDGVHLNGARQKRLCNNVNLWIENVLAEKLILRLPQLAFSTGSACASGKTEPSYVIQALGRSDIAAKCCVRFGLGRATEDTHIQTAITLLSQAIVELAHEG